MQIIHLFTLFNLVLTQGLFVDEIFELPEINDDPPSPESPLETDVTQALPVDSGTSNSATVEEVESNRQENTAIESTENQSVPLSLGQNNLQAAASNRIQLDTNGIPILKGTTAFEILDEIKNHGTDAPNEVIIPIIQQTEDIFPKSPSKYESFNWPNPSIPKPNYRLNFEKKIRQLEERWVYHFYDFTVTKAKETESSEQLERNLANRKYNFAKLMKKFYRQMQYFIQRLDDPEAKGRPSTALLPA